jgi:hypothetical protein
MEMFAYLIRTLKSAAVDMYPFMIVLMIGVCGFGDAFLSIDRSMTS